MAGCETKAFERDKKRRVFWGACGSNLLIEMSFFNIFLKQKKLGAAQVPYFFLPGAAQVPALLLIYIYILNKKTGCCTSTLFFPAGCCTSTGFVAYIYIY